MLPARPARPSISCPLLKQFQCLSVNYGRSRYAMLHANCCVAEVKTHCRGVGLSSVAHQPLSRCTCLRGKRVMKRLYFVRRSSRSKHDNDKACVISGNAKLVDGVYCRSHDLPCFVSTRLVAARPPVDHALHLHGKPFDLPRVVVHDSLALHAFLVLDARMQARLEGFMYIIGLLLERTPAALPCSSSLEFSKRRLQGPSNHARGTASYTKLVAMLCNASVLVPHR